MKIKKNQIIIYAISLMLVTAGYFNYVTFDNKVQETYSEDINYETQEETANVGDAVLVNNDEIVEKNSNTTSENNNKDTQISNTNKTIENKTEENKIAESQNETGKTAIENESTKENYFVSSKLERDKMYANMLTNYEAILNNTNSTEVQKNIATQEIAKINNTKNAIMICENLLYSKGFTNCLILVNEESVNIIVGTEEKLQQDKVAIIQNIISREMKKEIPNIHIGYYNQ